MMMVTKITLVAGKPSTRIGLSISLFPLPSPAPPSEVNFCMFIDGLMRLDLSRDLEGSPKTSNAEYLDF